MINIRNILVVAVVINSITLQTASPAASQIKLAQINGCINKICLRLGETIKMIEDLGKTDNVAAVGRINSYLDNNQEMNPGAANKSKINTGRQEIGLPKLP